MQELRHLLVRCIKMDGGSSKMMLLRRIGFIVPEPCTIPKPALCGFFTPTCKRLAELAAADS